MTPAATICPVVRKARRNTAEDTGGSATYDHEAAHSENASLKFCLSLPLGSSVLGQPSYPLVVLDPGCGLRQDNMLVQTQAEHACQGVVTACGDRILNGPTQLAESSSIELYSSLVYLILVCHFAKIDGRECLRAVRSVHLDELGQQRRRCCGFDVAGRHESGHDIAVEYSVFPKLKASNPTCRPWLNSAWLLTKPRYRASRRSILALRRPNSEVIRCCGESIPWPDKHESKIVTLALEARFLAALTTRLTLV